MRAQAHCLEEPRPGGIRAPTRLSAPSAGPSPDLRLHHPFLPHSRSTGVYPAHPPTFGTRGDTPNGKEKSKIGGADLPA
jgi:hypothetical protein